MKKKRIVLIGIVLGAFVLGGCGHQISNEVISIEKYKGLEVTEPTDEDDYAAVGEFDTAVWGELISNCSFKRYPQEEIEKKIEEIRLGYSYVVTEQKDTAQFIEEIHGMTVEELAEQELKKTYAIQLIAEKENLTLTDKEYRKKLEERADANGMSGEEYESLLGHDRQYQIFLEECVLTYLKEHLK